MPYMQKKKKGNTIEANTEKCPLGCGLYARKMPVPPGTMLRAASEFSPTCFSSMLVLSRTAEVGRGLDDTSCSVLSSLIWM